MKKHTILFLAANPSGTSGLTLGDEARDIQAELERSRYRDYFELETRWAAQPLDLLRELRKLKPSVVHFTGHGQPSAAGIRSARHTAFRDVLVSGDEHDAEPQSGLFFQAPDGLAQIVTTTALRDTFGAAGSSVKVVVLNACYSEVQAKALCAHVDCVVGMRGTIGDETARRFAIGFYGGLGECESVAAAFRQGCAAIGLDGLREADRPQLIARDGIDAARIILGFAVHRARDLSREVNECAAESSRSVDERPSFAAGVSEKARTARVRSPASSRRVTSPNNTATMAVGAHSDGSPSLLEPKATGGIHAGDGFTLQERYLALRISEFLADTTFTAFQQERAEDIDVWFSDGREHHQCKNENLTPGKIANLVSMFRTRFADLIKEKRLRRLVIAGSQIGPTLLPFIKNLDLYRSRRFDVGDRAEETATYETLRALAVEISLDGDLDFIVERVHFDITLASLGGPIVRSRQQFAVALAQVAGITSIDEAMDVAKAVQDAIHDDPKRSWTRDQVRTLLDAARRVFRERPNREAGEIVLIRHETLKHVDVPPSKETLPLLFGERRPVEVHIDDVEMIRLRDPARMSAAAAAFAASAGAYRAALGRPTARWLYYGFPHVPFGVLAGFLAGEERQVALVEHDRETGRFEWRPQAPLIGCASSATTSTGAHAARLRVSVSALVREQSCDQVIQPNQLCVDLQVKSNKIGRGIVGDENQAREYAAHVRALLDQTIAGDPDCHSLHVFAAVPVSVAFLLGQMLSHSSIPSCYVYNFEANARPQYAWRLGLHEAARGEPCVEFLTEASDGAV